MEIYRRRMRTQVRPNDGRETCVETMTASEDTRDAGRQFKYERGAVKKQTSSGSICDGLPVCLDGFAVFTVFRPLWLNMKKRRDKKKEKGKRKRARSAEQQAAAAAGSSSSAVQQQREQTQKIRRERRKGESDCGRKEKMKRQPWCLLLSLLPYRSSGVARSATAARQRHPQHRIADTIFSCHVSPSVVESEPEPPRGAVLS